MAVDITINETIDLVDITVNPNIIEVNVTRTSGGGGGSQTLEQTLVLGQRTGGKNIIVDDADAIELENTSLLKKGNYDFGGAGGISRICSVGYEDMWQSGIRHVFDNNGFIRHSTNCFNYIPDISYDSSLRFKVGSLWTLDDGTTYKCTDASGGAAVWEIENLTLPKVIQNGDLLLSYEAVSKNLTSADLGKILHPSVTTSIVYTLENHESSFKVGTSLFFTSGFTTAIDTSIATSNQNSVIFNGIEYSAAGLIPLTTGNFYRLLKFDGDDTTTGIWLLTMEVGSESIIPTKTSDLINDGDDGISHFITLNDLPSNIILYPTTVASDISTYFKMVSSISDPSFNTTAVDVSTGVITTTDQLISSLATSTNFIVGNPGVFNITTIGNISKVSGSGEAEFYFRVYKRTLAGTETLIVQSSNTIPVINTGYSEFSATGLWNDGTFLSTDRIVIKYYANRIAGGSNPTYQFQFGGITPVRTLVPIPLTVVPTLSLDGLSDVAISSVANKDIIQYDSSTSLWQNVQLYTPEIILNDMRTTSAVTGTTALTILNSYLAPANTFASNDRLQIDYLGLKSTAVGTGTYRIYINTTNSLTGATQIATFANATGSKFQLMQRNAAFKSATTLEIMLATTTNAYDLGTDGTLPSTITYNTAAAYYIITAVLPNSASDSYTQSRFAITRSKSKNTI